MLTQIIEKSDNRISLWVNFINEKQFNKIVEIGVYKGDFAFELLKNCKSIEKYFFIDPWKNLSDWNKPANNDNSTFDKFYNETISKTNFADSKRHVLRGKTTEVISEISDNSLDFVYIDGDHTLRGIAIDLISVWPKLKKDSYIAGDDFCKSIWQHSKEFEPTLVFPFAIYFAEAVGATFYALPYNQFLIKKDEKGYDFIDFTNGEYNEIELLQQFNKLDNSQNVKNKEGLIKKFLKKIIN